ncbi:MAG: sigma-54-dependent Fis family transcriptional regulator [Thermoanaerobaculia bacterium]|nr:sigma-54-dependent Fis family transcriptional regulator [Thermoanaerobaculia bacterium]
MCAASKASILVVDDEAAIRESLRMVLEFEGYRVEEARNGLECLQKVRERPPHAILLDLRMPEMDGSETLRALRERGYEMPVLVVSGHADVATAVEMTRRGAFDFFEKPFQSDRLLISVRNAVEARRLAEDKDGGPSGGESSILIGASPSMKRLRETIELAAPTAATVLVTGESGTGKELVARSIHDSSPRRGQPFVQVNCAAIPEELIESELFGHEKGSFTGAVRRQTGKFVAADGGTIFLDEVGDMSARTQAKVLRVLESGDVEPIGADKVVRVSVRVVAATNRKLEEEIEAGRFREDLFYRLNVVPIRTPALRERLEDVPLLVEHFARRFCEANNYRRKRFAPEAMELLQMLPFKGNVRELRNLVERLLILTPGDTIGRDAVGAAAGSARVELGQSFQGLKTLREFRDQAEKLFLVQKLGDHQWNVTQTALAIDTPRSNLYKKMEQYEIRRREAPAPAGDDD